MPEKSGIEVCQYVSGKEMYVVKEIQTGKIIFVSEAKKEAKEMRDKNDPGIHKAGEETREIRQSLNRPDLNATDRASLEKKLKTVYMRHQTLKVSKGKDHPLYKE